MAKTMKVLVVFDSAGTSPENQNFSEELKTQDWKAERHVIDSLKELEHEVHLLGVYDDPTFLFEGIKKTNPDIIFNLTEQFMEKASFDRHVVSLFELLKLPYTGTPPSGLLLAKNKGLTKKILSYHGIQTPAFQVCHRDEKLSLPVHLSYPILVKPLREEASYGISKNSLVTNEEDLVKRIQFVHETMRQDVIIEEFIEGRELYVSILGNRKLQVFPLREMVFEKKPDACQQFATFKAKWDEDYRKKWGIQNRFAKDLSDKLLSDIEKTAKKAYEVLYLKGYARLDLRLTKDNQVFIIEANPNPHIAKDEDYALSAKQEGLPYSELIQTILNLGIQEHRRFFER